MLYLPFRDLRARELYRTDPSRKTCARELCHTDTSHPTNRRARVVPYRSHWASMCARAVPYRYIQRGKHGRQSCAKQIPSGKNVGNRAVPHRYYAANMCARAVPRRCIPPGKHVRKSSAIQIHTTPPTCAQELCRTDPSHPANIMYMLRMSCEPGMPFCPENCRSWNGDLPDLPDMSCSILVRRDCSVRTDELPLIPTRPRIRPRCCCPRVCVSGNENRLCSRTTSWLSSSSLLEPR